jgi:hypothetical protein
MIEIYKRFARFARTRGRGGDENDRRKLGIVTAGTASGPMAVREKSSPSHQFW